MDYKEALIKDHQKWLLKEPCSRPDLVVTKYDESKSGLFHLPAQDWHKRVADDAARRLRDACLARAPPGRRSSPRQPAPGPEALAECVASELDGILQGVMHSEKLLYDGLPVHSLGEEQLCHAVTAHLGARPARTRLVRTSQCLHHGRRKLMAKAWQTHACDPATRPACAGLVRGVVSRERRAHFQASTSWSTSRSLAEARETLLSRFGRRLRSPASTSIIMQADVRCGPFSKFAVLSPKRCDTRPRGLGSKQSARARPGALI